MKIQGFYSTLYAIWGEYLSMCVSVFLLFLFFDRSPMLADQSMMSIYSICIKLGGERVYPHLNPPTKFTMNLLQRDII